MSGRPLEIVLELGLNADAKRGIDYYIENVVNHLAANDSFNRYTLFAAFFRDYRRKLARLPLPDQPNFRRLIRRFPEALVRALERERGLPLTQRLLLGGLRPDIYHVVGGGCLPRLCGPKTIVTAFDVAAEACPADGSAPTPGGRIRDPHLHDVHTRADCIISTGEYTRRDLERYHGVPPSKVEVIPTGVNLKLFRPVDDPAALAAADRKYGLPPKYFMVIGPYLPPRRANASFTLRAFAELKRRGWTEGCRLVFVGSPHPNLDALLGEARELGLADDVRCTGFVPVEDLPALYGRSVAVVHPTSVEGFGFGNEVMACRAAFITSDLPGVVEAVGDAALTVPPGQVAPLAEAMGRLLRDPAFASDLARRGFERAQTYSYDVIARRIIALYRRLAA